MIIFIKNKHTLQLDEFEFRCCVGNKGLTHQKKEGDQKTPKGIFKIGKLFENLKLNLSALRLTKIMDGVMTLMIKKIIINL